MKEFKGIFVQCRGVESMHLEYNYLGVQPQDTHTREEYGQDGRQGSSKDFGDSVLDRMEKPSLLKRSYIYP